MKEQIKKYEAQVQIIKAMSHPTRLFMIDKLSQKEYSVCELRDMIGDDLSTISKHLTVLKNAGLLLHDKRGSKVFYKVGISCVSRILTCTHNVLEAQNKI